MSFMNGGSDQEEDERIDADSSDEYESGDDVSDDSLNGVGPHSDGDVVMVSKRPSVTGGGGSGKSRVGDYSLRSGLKDQINQDQ